MTHHPVSIETINGLMRTPIPEREKLMLELGYGDPGRSVTRDVLSAHTPESWALIDSLSLPVQKNVYNNVTLFLIFTMIKIQPPQIG